MRKDLLIKLLEKYDKGTAFRWSWIGKNRRIRFLEAFLKTPAIATLPLEADISFKQFEDFLRTLNQDPDALFSLAYFYSHIQSVGVFIKFKYGIMDADLNTAVKKIPISKLAQAEVSTFLVKFPSEFRHAFYYRYLTDQDIGRLAQTASFFKDDTAANEIWIARLVEAGCDANLLLQLKENNIITHYKTLYQNVKRFFSPYPVKVKELWQLICLSGELTALQRGLEKQMIDKDSGKVGDHPIHCLAFAGQLEGIKLFQKTFQTDITRGTTTLGHTILHLAAAGNSVEVMRYALEKIPASTCNNQGHSALHMACANGAEQTLKLAFKELKLDAFSYDQGGLNALHLATLRGSKKGIRLAINLLGISRYSLSIHVPSGDRRCGILHIAAARGNVGILRFIHDEFKMDYSIKDGTGANILCYAVCSNNIKMMQFVLKELGSKSNSINNYKQTALHIAAGNGKSLGIEFCVTDLGVDLYQEDIDNQTAMYEAIERKRKENIIALRELGYDPNHRDSLNRSAFDYLNRIQGFSDSEKAELLAALSDPLQSENVIVRRP